MVCLDSDFIIDFLKNNSLAVKQMQMLRDKNAELRTTSINAFELLKGANYSKKKSDFEVIRAFLSNVSVLDFDMECSEKAASIYEELRAKGEMVDVLDLIIASIAIVNNELLITRNVKHFHRIPGLNLEEI